MNPLRTAVEMTFRCVARWRHGRAVHAQGVELDAELTLDADSLWGSRSRLRARTCSDSRSDAAPRQRFWGDTSRSWLLSVVWSTRDVGAVVVALPTACPAAPCTGDRIVVVGVPQMADRRGRSQPRSPLGVAN